MIRRLTGTIQDIFSEAVLLDVHGVGYEVFVTTHHSSQLIPKRGGEAVLSIYTHVKEDALQLYGFSGEQERELFLQLLSVSGVGPRTALGVLDRGAASVVSAIQNSDVSFFQGVPRLGKKTAQKIIVDLQSKLGKVQDLALGPVSSTLREVQDALTAMGFAEADVRQALLDTDPELDAAAALKLTLAKLKK